MNLQSVNRTLLNLLDKQKRMQAHMEYCLEETKNEKEEAILQKEVIIHQTEDKTPPCC